MSYPKTITAYFQAYDGRDLRIVEREQTVYSEEEEARYTKHAPKEAEPVREEVPVEEVPADPMEPTKEEIAAWAMDRYGVKIDKRKSREKMLEQLDSLHEDDAA